MKLKAGLLVIALLAGSFLLTHCKKDKDENKVASGTCSDGIKNQDESNVDCGGVCSKCMTCSDGIKNQNETGIDCGGPCGACPIVYQETGLYGKNILYVKTTETIQPGDYSMCAKLPADTKLKVKVTNANGGPINNYTYVINTNFQVVNENNQGIQSQSFVAEGPLSADVNLTFGPGPITPANGSIKMEIFENDASTPTWTKFLSW